MPSCLKKHFQILAFLDGIVPVCVLILVVSQLLNLTKKPSLTHEFVMNLHSAEQQLLGAPPVNAAEPAAPNLGSLVLT